MVKYGIILQLLAGVVLGLDHLIPPNWLEKINGILSKILSYASAKTGRAKRISFLVALFIPGLAIASTMVFSGAMEIDSWEDILGIILGVIFLISLGGVTYTQLLDLIAKKVRQKHVLRHKGEEIANDRDVLMANLFLLPITVLSGVILGLILFALMKIFPYIILASIIYIFLFPALIGSLFYLLTRGLIALLDKISKMPKGALGPLALGLFIVGGIIILIDVW